MILVLLLCSCELMYKSQEKGKLYVLSIGMKYADIGYPDREGKVPRLDVCPFDAQCVAEAFDLLNTDPNAVINCFTDSENGFYDINTLLLQIRTLASVSKPNDIFVFYYSGHGITSNNIEDNPGYIKYENSAITIDSASLIFSNKSKIVEFLSCRTLLDELSAFKGKVVIIGDFCYSGSLISENNVSVDSHNYYHKSNKVNIFEDLLFSNTSVINTYPNLYILCASKPYEQSFTSNPNSVFTKGLLKALGYEDGKLSKTIAALWGKEITLQSLALSTNSAIESDRTSTAAQHIKVSSRSDDLVILSY